jgi:hypothetical protein
LQGEVGFGNSREALDPVFDAEFFGCDGLLHTIPPNLVWDSRGLLSNYSAMRRGRGDLVPDEPDGMME